MTEEERVVAAFATSDAQQDDSARRIPGTGYGAGESVDRIDRIPRAGSETGHNGHSASSVNSVDGFPGHDPGQALRDLDGWEEPLPIEQPPLPSFPTAELGPNLAPFVEAVAEQFQVPVDLPAMTVLGVISASVGGRRRIKVREGWDETTSLWMAAVAGSSELKSPDAHAGPASTSPRSATAKPPSSRRVLHRIDLRAS